VSDRFTGSSLAYQGYGRGLDVDAVRALSLFATGGVEPDAYVLLDVPLEVARARLGAERDRMEAAGDDFHERVRAGYHALAAAEGWLVVDGSGSVEQVGHSVWEAVSAKLQW
jgi:dTMP kinase